MKRDGDKNRHMKKFLIGVFLVALVVSGCITQHKEEVKESAVAQYYTLRVYPSLADHTMAVEAEVTVTVPADVEDIDFCLNPVFSLSSVTDEQGNAVAYEEEYDLITVKVPLSPEPVQRTFTFEYEGLIYRRVLNVTWDYVGEEGCWVRSEYNWYPVIPETGEMGCHFWEYWYNNYWEGVTVSNFWNCWHQGYWAGATVSVDVPESWTVISSGTLITEDMHGNTKTCTWQEDQIIPSVNFVAGEYDTTEKVWNGKEITCYATEHTEYAHKYIGIAAEILNCYSEKFGEYPFQQFSIVELPGTEGYSSGKPSFVLMDSALFEEDEKEVVHALGAAIAYQWWGTAVAGYDPPSLISLEVCLPHYASLLFIREKYGEDVFYEYLIKYRQEIEETFAEYGSASITKESAFIRGRGFQRNAVIMKTVLMFHALREEVGEDQFFEGLQTFFAEHRGESVTTEDLKEEFEQLTGNNLDKFFEKYYYGTDIPDI